MKRTLIGGRGKGTRMMERVMVDSVDYIVRVRHDTKWRK